MVTCPKCQERMVADRLADHVRYQHTAPSVRCDHCGRKLERDVSRGYSKRFCNGKCQSLNYQAFLKTKRAFEEYKAARGFTTTTES